METRHKKSQMKHVVYLVTTLLLSAFLMLAALFVDGFAEWYARTVFPFFPLVIGRIVGLAPFSLFETIILGIGISILMYIVWNLLYLIHLLIAKVKTAEKPLYKPLENPREKADEKSAQK